MMKKNNAEKKSKTHRHRWRHSAQRSAAPLALSVLILRGPVATIVVMAGIHRCTLLHRWSKRGISHSRISFPVVITNLVSMGIVMHKNTVTSDTRHGHSVTFLFVFMLVNFPNRPIWGWSGAMKRGGQHRWPIEMWKPIRIRKPGVHRPWISLMGRLTLIDNFGICIELRWNDWWFPVVMVIVLNGVIFVLGFSFNVEQFRRLWRFDFNPNSTVGDARVRVFRRISRGRVPVAYTTLLHPKDVHCDAAARVKPRIRPRRITAES